MKRIMLSVFLVTACVCGAATRPVPEYLKSAVVYQIVLRNFTRDGNFKAAAEMLDHVRSAGVDIVYLTPFVEMDRDMDVTGWSPRQVRSGFGSPKNSYRISDYDKIDPEYGDDADFKAFTDKAHACGMKVFMDLVYVHCGPNNVLKDRYPDAFQKNRDGTLRLTRWGFPHINFKSQAVRRYLIDSMLRWMSLGCDGFRCDVGDSVPIDFWVEAVTACRKVNPELVMINEGRKPEWLEKAFDVCYGMSGSISVRKRLIAMATEPDTAKGRSFAKMMAAVRKYEASIPADAFMLCFMDNHDTATDDWELRFDRIHPVEVGNAAFVFVFLRRGLPMLFNGNEIADNALNSFFGPVEHPARAFKTVDWGRALQPAGRKRLALIRRLAELRHAEALFQDAPMTWVTDGEKKGVIAFTRQTGGRRAFVAVNIFDRPISFSPSGVTFDPAAKPFLAERFSFDANGAVTLGPWGFVAVEVAPAR